MSKKVGSKEGIMRDPSISMLSEQRSSESSKQKIAKIHDMFPDAKKDCIAKILQYYEDDESKAIDAITRDGGIEAVSNWAESGSLKSKNNKNKKKKKKTKRESGSGVTTTASFDADDSSSLHSSSNIDADVEKECQRTENGNGLLADVGDDTNDTNSILSSHERFKNAELDSPSNEQIREFDAKADYKLVPEASTTIPSEDLNAQNLNRGIGRDLENTMSGSPVSDSSEKPELGLKKEKYKPIIDNHAKHIPRQRTSSSRRSKTSSLSEDSSSQHNPQATAAPTKRGFERCKKDLNRQTISLQRINLQMEKGLEESGKKLKNAFNDVRKMLERRLELVESEFQKTKEEALSLLKSRQDLAIDLKRRVDRTPSLTEAEWTELRSDIKQFVTERKYDEELGKTVWFQWSLDSITESINSFGEVQPVKNVYSQHSHSSVGNSATLQNNPEPSPSSSVANEEINSSADKNDIGNISDMVEDEAPPVSKEIAPPFKPNTTRIYSNTRYVNNSRYPNNRGRGAYFRGNNRGSGNYRPHFNRNYNYRNYNNSEMSGEYRYHPHQERESRTNEGPPHAVDRNINNISRDNRNDRNQGRGDHTNYRSSTRYRGHVVPRQNLDSTPKVEPLITEPNADSGKSNVVNGFENN